MRIKSIICFYFSLACFLSFNIFAQAPSGADIRFGNENVNCPTADEFCVDVQFQSSDAADFAVGGISYRFSYNTGAVANPVVTGNAPWNAFPYNITSNVSVIGEVNISNSYTFTGGAFTATNAGASWESTATICFDIVDAGMSPNLVFNTGVGQTEGLYADEVNLLTTVLPSNYPEGSTFGDATSLSCTLPADCLGVPGGTATIGSTCDDADATTGNDVYQADCSCAGEALDCLGVAGGTATIGSTCDDGDATTGNDVYQADCSCAGEALDCLGVAGGTATIGSTCDDGDPGTSGDVYQADCSCAGSTVDCLGVPGGTATIGSTCDDGDATTGNDVYQADCSCAGEALDCLGVAGGTATVGSTCDDGDATTGNDVYQADCSCAGESVDCLGVAGGTATIGSTCDDGDATTGNDVYQADCSCAGEALDCLGVAGGTATIGSTCDDGDANTTSDVYQADCTCAGVVVGTPPTDANIQFANSDLNCPTGDTYCIDVQFQNSDAVDFPFGGVSYRFSYNTSALANPVVTGQAPWNAFPYNITDNVSVIGEVNISNSYTFTGGAFTATNAGAGFETTATICFDVVDAALSPDLAFNTGVGQTEALYADEGALITTILTSNYPNGSTEGATGDLSCLGPVDCLGVPGGTATVGTTCDDGDATTGNDVYQADCSCAGEALDCEGTPGGTAVAGTTCDDGDATTGNDVYQADCSCAGEALDCEGTPGGTATVGTTCDDGDPATTGDVYQSDCSCAGQAVDCEGTPGGSATVGTTCDDGDATTGNDVYQADCTCAGEPFDCLGVAGGTATIGSTCDDGDATTGNDVYQADCTCAGSTVDCEGTPGGSAVAGTACDDGDATTGNDVYQTDCSCAGEFIDCEGVAGGTSLVGTTCDDGDITTGNDVYQADCTCAGDAVDCLGVPGGSATIGSACDDGNAATSNDVYQSDCTCAGEIPGCTIATACNFEPLATVNDGSCNLEDCEGNCDGTESGPAQPGETCDDFDPGTYDDQYQNDCTCAGTPYDCQALQADFGDTCDDSDATTINDVITVACECAGTSIFDCPSLSADFGDICDDGDANTDNDTVQSDCTCAGEFVCSPDDFAGVCSVSLIDGEASLSGVALPIPFGSAVAITYDFPANASTPGYEAVLLICTDEDCDEVVSVLAPSSTVIDNPTAPYEVGVEYWVVPAIVETGNTFDQSATCFQLGDPAQFQFVFQAGPGACQITDFSFSGTPSDCDPETNTYTLNVSVDYINSDGSDLVINGQSFTAPAGAGTVDATLSLFSDAGIINLSASLGAGCTADLFVPYFAPESCIEGCLISAIAGDQGACNPDDGTFIQNVIVSYTNQPATGDLIVNGNTFTIDVSPQTVQLLLVADGNPIDVSASFSADASCSVSVDGFAMSPESCFDPCFSNPVDVTAYSICSDGVATLFIDLQPGVTYSYEGGGSAFNGDVLQHLNTYTVVGSNAAGCEDSTDPFEVYCIETPDPGCEDIDGGTVSTVSGNSSIDICVGDGMSNVIAFTNDGGGDNYAYIVTDSGGSILAVLAGNNNDFEGAGPGTCLLYGVAYSGELSANPGSTIATVSSDDCFSLSSNSVTINRYDSPDASVSEPSGVICNDSAEGASSLDLNDLVSGTDGGTWSGTGVSGSTFDGSGLDGIYTLTYSVEGEGSCSDASESIQVVVADCNQPPVTVATSLALSIGVSGGAINVFDSGDFDPDGDPITLVAVDDLDPSVGTLTFDANGDVNISINPDYAGGVTSVSYSISDGINTTTGTLTITVSACTAEAGTLSVDQDLVCFDLEAFELSSAGSNADNEQTYILVDAFGAIVGVDASGFVPYPQDGDYVGYAVNYDPVAAPDFTVGSLAELEAQAGVEGVCFDLSEGLELKVLEEIHMEGVPYCDPTFAGGYFVDVFITGGFPEYANFGNYSINFPPNNVIWNPEEGYAMVTIGPIPSVACVTVDVDGDGFSCEGGPLTVCFDEVCEIECDPTPGVMPDQTVYACDGGTVSATSAGLQLDEDDISIYALHTSATSEAGDILDANDSGTFSLPAGGSTNTTYYISAVVGPDENGDGVPDLDNDLCTAVAAGTPVVFLDPISFVTSEICNEEGDAYNVVVDAITGGLPAFMDDATYTVSGNELVTDVSSSTIIGPITAGEAYIVIVGDDAGCNLTFESSIISCKPMPIELLSFVGEVLPTGNMLKWVTATEYENDFFTLYRSTDGVSFEAVTTIEGAGDSFTAIQYQFEDKEAPNGLSYYRLDQTDFDGTTTSSNVITLNRGELNFSITQVSPIPTFSQLAVNFYAAQEGKVTVSVLDVAGRLIQSDNFNAIASTNNFTLDVSQLSAGVYFLSLNNGETVSTVKFVKE